MTSRNKTISIDKDQLIKYREKTLTLKEKCDVDFIKNKTIFQNNLEAISFMPDNFVDLLILDPPYNLDKKFNETSSFTKLTIEEYSNWLDSFIKQSIRLLKKNASVYIFGDWKSSTSIHLVARKYFNIQNRITWEREKGRGAQRNWKNCSEDIWFCTLNDSYVFNVENVKLKRKVIAPYRDDKGKPKDWNEDTDGNYRLTYPSNLMTDITIPFWSMPENTEHPTQKPEKLIAKLILASSNNGDVVLDPFLGSGTTSVVSKKLKRNYIGIEVDSYFCCISEKRLAMADEDASIQGYRNGVFLERNTNYAEMQKDSGFYFDKNNKETVVEQKQGDLF